MIGLNKFKLSNSLELKSVTVCTVVTTVCRVLYIMANYLGKSNGREQFDIVSRGGDWRSGLGTRRRNYFLRPSNAEKERRRLQNRLQIGT